MAPGWEMGLGMDVGFGMGVPAAATTTTSPSYLYGLPAAVDNMRVDDLLDLSNDMFPSTAMVVNDAELYQSPDPSSTINCSQPFISGDSDSSSSFNLYPTQLNSFPNDLYIPSEEAAELEWLSKFVDDSFSDLPSSACNLMAPSLSTITRVENNPSNVIPGRGTRTRRSVISNNNVLPAAATWSSYTSPTLTPHHQQQNSTSSTSSSSSSEFPSGKLRANINSSASSGKGKKSANAADGIGLENGVRRCTHCASDKTPQWRTGPLGPKTLCNACGVRYKSGRLVPEYRPAASPTFVLTQHSNSHRKVIELRRQKELLLLNQQNKSSSAAVTARPDQLLRDYEVC